MTETTQVERLARAMSDAEPVAWKCQERTMGAWYTRYVDERPAGERYRNIVPLYSAPQPHTAPMPHEQGRDEVERLREALEPFAEYADWVDSCEQHPDGCPDNALAGETSFTVGDLRRARAALSSPLS